MSRITLTQKALILVSVPLVFSLVYAACLITVSDRSATGNMSTTTIRWIVTLGSICNVLMSALLAFVFGQSLSKRLNVIIDNVIRIAHEEPLLEPLSGHDEIAHLDGIVHSLGDIVNQNRANWANRESTESGT